MLQIVLKLIGSIIILAGIILIFDARSISKKMFDFGNQNDSTSGFKMLGTILSVVGAIIVLFQGI